MLLQGNSSEAIADFVGENVVVSSDAVVALSVVLEVMPGSQLVIASGVCIGSDVIVQAYGGRLILEAGVSLGKGVLLLGAGTVGTRACVGADSTLINPMIEADQVIPARSLIGDTSRSLNAQPSSASPLGCLNGQSSRASAVVVAAQGSEVSANGSNPASQNGAVYGRDQVMQLVQTLFPYRQAVMSESEPS